MQITQCHNLPFIQPIQTWKSVKSKTRCCVLETKQISSQTSPR